jgi:hypothetical protein
MCASCPANIIPHDLIIVIVFDEASKF